METEKVSAELIELLCKFLNSPIKENLDPLKTEICKTRSVENRIPSIFVQQKYQTFIYQLVLQLTKLNERQNELKVDLINCINSLILRTRIHDINMVKTLITIILKQIHDFEKSTMKTNISEELKCSVVVCLSNILIYTNNDILELFYVKDMCIILGKICVTCVSILVNEKYRKLKLSTIKCIMAVFYVHDKADFNDVVLRKQVADTMFLFLPKLASTLIKIVIGDINQGENLITGSIQCLGRLLVILFEDDVSKTIIFSSYETQDFQNLIAELNTSEKKNRNDYKYESNSSSKNLKDTFLAQQSRGRTIEWQNQVMNKLKLILQPMSLLRANQSFKIRYEFGLFCINIVEKCSISLASIMRILVESIIALLMDDNECIKVMCTKCIKKIHNQALILNLYEENIEKLFEEHLTSLPRVIYRSESSEQIAAFMFLHGFIKNLTDIEMKRIFMYPGNLEKFCMCLISAFDLTLHNNLLIEEYALRTMNQIGQDNDKFKWRIFKYIESKKAADLLNDICITLGKSVVSHSVFDYLMQLMEKNVKFSNQIILILVFLTSGDSCNEQNRDIACLLLEALLNEKHWHLALTQELKDNSHDPNKYTSWFIDRTPGLYESAIEIRTKDIQSDDEDESQINILDVKFNVLHTCIILEAIGNLALYLRKEFQSFVFSSLYRVLLKSGSSNYCIHLSSQFSLNCIKKALNFNKISELIHCYADYIVYHINNLMKRTNESESAIDLLSVVLSLSSISSLPHLENIIYTLLNECTKTSQNSNLTSFLKVFHIFLISIEKWSTNIYQELNLIDETPSEMKSNIFDIWMEILTRNKNFIDENIFDKQNFENDISQNDDIEDDNVEEKIENQDLSSNIKIVKSLLNAVLKFIPSKVQIQRILSLECLIAGLPQLRHHENELLPLVCSIWYPLTERFKENDFVVLNRSFMLLEVLARYAKDFILKRSLKDVIPVLNKFLKESAKRSECETILIPTQELILKTTILKGYASLIINLNLQTKNLYEVCEAIHLYLNKNQPEILQKCAVNFFKDISYYNRPLMYLCLVEILNFKEFEKNVKIVFDFIKIT